MRQRHRLPGTEASHLRVAHDESVAEVTAAKREIRELKDQLVRLRSTLKETERDLSKVRKDRMVLKAHVVKETADFAELSQKHECTKERLEILTKQNSDLRQQFVSVQAELDLMKARAGCEPGAPSPCPETPSQAAGPTE